MHGIDKCRKVFSIAKQYKECFRTRLSEWLEGTLRYKCSILENSNENLVKDSFEQALKIENSSSKRWALHTLHGENL